MKKIISTLLSVCMLFVSLTYAYAMGNTNESVNVEYFEDGSYIVTTIDEDSSDVTLLSTTTTKSKTSTYYASDGTAQWYVKVTGTFTYGNGSSKCTASSVTAGVYSSNWKIASKSSSYTGSTAIATVAVNQLVYGVVANTIARTVTLTCSSTGTFS